MATVRWTGPTTGSNSFGAAANWQFGVVPGAVDLVDFNTPAPALFTVTGNALVGGIEDDNDDVYLSGIYTTSGALATELTVNASSGLFLDIAPTAAVLGTGAISVTSGRLQVEGALTGSSLTVSSNAALWINYGANISLTGSLNLNNGGLEALNAADEPNGSVFTLAVPIVVTGTTASIGTILNQTMTVTGPISGTGVLNISVGTVTLTGNDTYTGGTTINSFSSLVVGAGELPSTGTLTFNSGGLLSTASQTINNTRVMSGYFVLAAAAGQTLILNAPGSANTWTLNGNGGNTVYFGETGYTGTVEWGFGSTGSINGVGQYNVEIQNGTLKAIDGAASFLLNDDAQTIIDAGATYDLNSFNANANDLTGAGHLTNSSATAATFVDANGGTFSGVIDGKTALTVASGNLALSGANAYTGGTTINSSASLTLGGGSITGNVTDNGTLVSNNTVGSITLGGNITGTGKFTQQGAGQTTTLSGSNNYSGGSTISGGTLALASGALPSTGTLTISGGELLANASQTINNTRALSGTFTIAAAHNQTLTWGNTTAWSLFENTANNTVYIGNTGQDGTVLWGTNGGSISSGGSAFNVEVRAGTFKALDANFGLITFAAAETTVDAGATIDIAGQTTFINDLQGSGQVADSGAAAFLQVNGGNFGGVIAGTTKLEVVGSVAFALSGTNTYSGGTQVDAGATLILGNGGSTGSTGTSGAITDNGTVDVRRSDFFSLPTLTGTGNLVVEGPGTVAMNSSMNYSGGTLLAGGTLLTNAISTGSGAITFLNGSTATLQIAGPSALPNAIVNFSHGDVIDFPNVVFNSLSYAGGVLTMKENGTTVDHITVATPYASPMFRLSSDGNGGTQVTVDPPAVGPTPTFDPTWNIVGIKDFNADGLSDIGWQHTGDNTVEIEFAYDNFNIGGGIIRNSPFDGSWSVASSGDFNGDGNGDLVYRHAGDGITEIQLLNSNAGIGGGMIANNPFDSSWTIVASGDYNGDGKTDLLWQQAASGTVQIQLLNGTTGIGGGLITNNPFDNNWQVITSGDFTGDGKADLAWQNKSSGIVELQFLNGNNSIGGGLISNNPFDAGWNIVAAGDFNGDGFADLAYQRQSDGTVEVQLLNGNNSVGGGLISNNPFGSGWQVVGAGDFNGDGKADLVYRNTSTGTTEVQFLNGTNNIGGGVIALG